MVSFYANKNPIDNNILYKQSNYRVPNQSVFGKESIHVVGITG